MLLPVAAGIAVLSGLAWFQTRRVMKGELTPEREKIFMSAMASMKDTAELRGLADKYQQMGLPHEAEMLRKRAALRDLPKEVADKRREGFKKAMSSTNKEALAAFAGALEAEGAIGAAEKVRQRIASLLNED